MRCQTNSLNPFLAVKSLFFKALSVTGIFAARFINVALTQHIDLVRTGKRCYKFKLRRTQRGFVDRCEFATHPKRKSARTHHGL